MMSYELSITLISIAWSAGIVVGLFTAKYVSKKECKETMQSVWNRIDDIQNCMTGGKITFDVHLSKGYETNNVPRG